MAAWKNNLQPASYKDVGFEVVSTKDTNEKALAEHARPFVNGIDIEDMGTQGRQCQVSALFNGYSFDTKMTDLIEVLEEQGAGVLVHPIFGRRENVIASSWSFNVEAEMVSYVAIDITFREVTESEPIFVFENKWLTKLDQLDQSVDGMTGDILEYVDMISMVTDGSSALWGRANGMWGALNGIFGAVRHFFDFDFLQFPSSNSYSTKNYSKNVQTQSKSLSEMIDTGLKNESVQNTDSLPAKNRYDSTAKKVDELNKLPQTIITGQNDTAEHSQRINQITPMQMRPFAVFIQVLSITILIKVAVNLIENDSDVITIKELQHINNDVRQRVQQQIDELRQTYEIVNKSNSPQDAAIYTATHNTIESLRQITHEFNALILALIEQRPPLRIKQATLDGTMHQIAHELYKDVTRTEELIRLNSHLTHPSFIKRGDWINYYVR